MQSNEFRLVTRWQAEASISEIAAILQEPERFTDWWGDVYLSVRTLVPGGPDGVGRRIAVTSRGWLPYRISWTGELVEAEAPRRWVIEARGDLNGRGTWTLTQKGRVAEAVYDWRITADRPLFRALSLVAKPLLAWNHRWAMRRGEEGLRREVERRRMSAAA